MKRLLIATSLAVAVLAFAGWVAYQVANPKAPIARGLLAPPPTGALKFAGSAPAHPFRQEEQKVFSRRLFRSSGTPQFSIDVRDLLVAPHGQGRIAALSGPALLEVMAGPGRATTDERSIELEPGAATIIEPRQVLRIENPSRHPLVLRLYVVEAK